MMVWQHMTVCWTTGGVRTTGRLHGAIVPMDTFSRLLVNTATQGCTPSREAHNSYITHCRQHPPFFRSGLLLGGDGVFFT